MNRTITFLALALSLGIHQMAAAAPEGCPADSVRSGTVCIDKYEATVWQVQAEHVGVIRKIQDGKVLLADLQAAHAVQLGLAPGDLEAAGCPPTGNGCVNVYAVSIPGMTPSRYLTWFQALATARNSLKRLPTNQEWQAAALGTPDGAPCAVENTSIPGDPGCVSDVGAFDMVGGVSERVADWADRGGDFNCMNWPSTFGDDLSCVGGVGSADVNRLPGTLVRGGSFGYRANGGPFAAVVLAADLAANAVGFRCVR